MNPNDGEILAMVNYPEFDLNDPFSVTEEMRERYEGLSDDEVLNKMWRNPCVSDTYEPGSTFKIITAAAALEKDVVSLDDPFYCPGYRIVADRRIRCAKVQGHGSETFETGIMNSCNPVFIEVGERIGVEDYYKYFNRFSLAKKTGIDLPGEAATIMHDMENVGQVELATISFGQSFQITPVRLLATVSSIINGGTSVTPHFGVDVKDSDGNVITTFDYEQNTDIVSEETSETMQYLLERVVSEGGGTLAQVEGYEIGGKTATSQTLPRSDNRYISSFLGFAPADDPQIIAIVIIDNPVGTYYGGTIAAPVFSEIMNNILPGIL
jgi:stage V sporulation protein D (sporulation-specific penicillin-binding protein)